MPTVPVAMQAVKEKLDAQHIALIEGIEPRATNGNLDRVVAARRLGIDTRLIGQGIFQGGRAAFFDFGLSHQAGAASDFIELGLSGLHVGLFGRLHGDRTQAFVARWAEIIRRHKGGQG